LLALPGEEGRSEREWREEKKVDDRNTHRKRHIFGSIHLFPHTFPDDLLQRRQAREEVEGRVWERSRTM